MVVAFHLVCVKEETDNRRRKFLITHSRTLTRLLLESKETSALDHGTSTLEISCSWDDGCGRKSAGRNRQTYNIKRLASILLSEPNSEGRRGVNAGGHVLLVSKRIRQRKENKRERKEMEQGEGRMTS